LPNPSNNRPTSIIGPFGEPLTLDSLPPPNLPRWVARRKAELVAAVEGGLLTVEEVCARYKIEREEFAAWQTGVDRFGMRGLWVTRSQQLRERYEHRLGPGN
jgi:Protein of unknown function (DUF1153)